MVSIAVLPQDSSCIVRATQLAQWLHLPLASSATEYSLLLIVTPDYLALQHRDGATGLLKLDFMQGALAHRLRQQSTELLLKAVGKKPHQSLSVVDATAGLGRDGMILAAAGCAVRLLERSPILYVLLADALKRAASCQLGAFELLQVDALDYLQQLAPADYPEVIYLDPMFPQRTKSAAVKKELIYLQQLVGEDLDAPQLLELALTRAQKRIVVKRPRIAPCLNERTPDFVYTGKRIRFDVYRPLRVP